MKIKTTMRFLITLVSITIIKQKYKKVTNVGKDMKKNGTSMLIGR